MSNESYYTYYKVDAVTSAATLKEHEETVAAQRSALISDALRGFDAEAFSTQNEWAGPPTVVGILVKDDHPLLKEPHVLFQRKQRTDDGVLNLVRGRGNTKDGKRLNSEIAQFSKALKDLPAFTDWVVPYFDIMTSAIGEPHPTKRGGFAMIRTHGGFAGEHLVFAVPKEGDRDVEVPACFEQITYGQFYDMTEGA